MRHVHTSRLESTTADYTIEVVQSGRQRPIRSNQGVGCRLLDPTKRNSGCHTKPTVGSSWIGSGLDSLLYVTLAITLLVDNAARTRASSCTQSLCTALCRVPCIGLAYRKRHGRRHSAEQQAQPAKNKTMQNKTKKKTAQNHW